MANLKFSSEILDDALSRANEPTDGTSDYEAQALIYLNRAYRALYMGGTEFDPEVNENWWWMRSQGSLILNPNISDKTAQVSPSNSGVVFSATPSVNIQDYFFKVGSHPDVFKVASFTTGTNSATLDTVYTGSSASAATCNLMDLEYALVSGIIKVIDPMRIYGREDNDVKMISVGELEAKYPMDTVTGGTPESFAMVTETTARFNRFVSDLTRVDYDYFAQPADLTDSGTEEPVVPLQYRHILADMTAFFILLDKDDTKAEGVAAMAKAGIRAMAIENKTRLRQAGQPGTGNLTFTADLIKDMMIRADEPTDGSSMYDDRALIYLNRAYRSIYMGGTEFDPEINEDWWWMRSQGSLILNSSVTDGSVSVIKGDDTVYFPDPVQERSNPSNLRLNGITWNGSFFVAVGNEDATDSYIITSSDGINWSEQLAPKAIAIRNITWNGSIFVAVGDQDATDATIYTSPDGVTWTERANPKNFALLDVVWNGSLFCAVGSGDGTDAYIVTSPDGTTWTERSNPSNVTLNAIEWNGSLFCAVGSSSGGDAYIVTSPDGVTWTERSNPKAFSLFGVIWNGSLFVAVGAADGTDAYIVTSPDGITWTERANPKNFALTDVAWGGSLFCAVGVGDGSDGYIVTSLDGITWTERSNPKNFQLNRIAWNGSFFVAVGVADGTDAYILTLRFNDYQDYFLRLNNHNDVYKISSHTLGDISATLDANYSGDTDIAASYRLFDTEYTLATGIIKVTSPMHGHGRDNTDIKLLQLSEMESKYPMHSVSGGTPDSFAMVTETTARFNRYATDLTRIDYDYMARPADLSFSTTEEPVIPKQYRHILSDAAAFYLMLDKDPANAEAIAAIAKAGIRAMAVENRSRMNKSGQPGTGNLTYTADLIKDALIRADEPTDGSSIYDDRVLVYLNRAYKALYMGGSEFDPEVNEDWWWMRSEASLILDPVKEDNTISAIKGSDIVYLPDPLTELSNPKNISLYNIVYSGSLFVAVGLVDGTDAYIVTSPDGITWTERSNPKNINMIDIQWNGSLFCAVGEADGIDAYIATSTDGITWTERSNPKNFNLSGITWNGKIFVAVGDADGTDAYIITSPDGITWTERSNPKNFRLDGVIWNGSIFCAVGGADGIDAYIITSTDGITWTEQSNPKNITLREIDWNGSIFCAGGDADGTDSYIVTSSDGITWTERSNPMNLSLRTMYYSRGLFVAGGVATGTRAYLIVSSDGITWNEVNNPKSFPIRGIVSDGNNFICVGEADGTDSYMISVDLTSYNDYFLKANTHDDVFKIKTHKHGDRLAVLDTNYTGDSSASLSYRVFRYEYDLASDVIKIIGPMRGYGDRDNEIDLVSLESMDHRWPLHKPHSGIPTEFAMVGETRVRFNRYGDDDGDYLRVDYDYLARPTELTYSNTEEPLIPKEYRHVLSDMAAFFVLLDKGSEKAEAVGAMARSGLKAMELENKSRWSKAGHPGRILPRQNDVPHHRRFLRSGSGVYIA